METSDPTTATIRFLMAHLGPEKILHTMSTLATKQRDVSVGDIQKYWAWARVARVADLAAETVRSALAEQDPTLTDTTPTED